LFFVFLKRSFVMKYRELTTASLIVATIWIAGCSKSNNSTTAAKKANDTAAAPAVVEHAHGKGPNGGVVFDLGGHHAEFTVEHGKHECTILVLGDDEKTPMAVDAKEFVLNTKETKTADGKVVPPMTITMKPVDAPNGKATKFTGSDPGIGNVADFAGTVAGEIDGKPAMGEFKE
jgi:hypothetical protein